ncbi:nodulation protein NfeD [candidate division KSB3 bacterium]|uniref:Nodulation protein NfeD n=1 Tax=candidate division KSB3 bacterium TaxID=2044937 RepID=A0A9D5JYN4_9BACT|nr:nodulation protein NfeD [candidate division KSB3 bacterium]MBD3326687.1 nodulation protein NfeD [candidate division KSB3 bacterium]
MMKQNVFQVKLPCLLLLLLLFFPVIASAAPRVYKMPIEGMIDRGVAPYVRRVLQEASNADAVILEINTLGGMVDAAIQIRDALLDSDVMTIAFINKRAISAGALISLATDHIVMTPGATIGAATPIQIDAGGQGNPVSEKYVSYFRTEMRATAEKTGRRGDIAEAMVDAEYEIEGLSEKGKLLTLTTQDALTYEIADYEVVTFEDVLERFDLAGADVITARINWAERLVRFLTNPLFSSLLMMLGFLGLYIEFKTPGFGIGGTLGIVCLGLFFWGHFLVRLAGWEELILFVAGIILLLIELLVIPGFGVVGILGILAILTSLALSMVGRFELLTLQDVQVAVSKLTAALVGSILLAVVLAKFLPRTSLGKQVILKDIQQRDAGYISQPTDQRNLIGMVGVTLTALHPSGTMVLNDKRYDVVSEGGFIEKNTRVKVLSVEGARMVVREAADTPQEPSNL